MVSKLDEFLIKLASTITDEGMFNPYNQVCKKFDLSTAPGLRQGNLRLYLESFKEIPVETIWVVNETELHNTKLTGIPGVEPIDYAKVEAKLGLPAHFENTHKNGSLSILQKAHVNIWDFLSGKSEKPLIWHVLPFYPHDPKNITNKREPTDAEIKKYGEFFNLFTAIFKPKKIIAIGPSAKKYLEIINVRSPIQSVRI